MNTAACSKKYKIGVLVNNPSKQMSGQYDQLAQLEDYEFWLLYREQDQGNPAWTPSLPASGKYEFLAPPQIKLWGRLKSFISSDPVPVLARHNFDAVIIHGIYDNLAVWRTISWCKSNNKPYLLRCDANVCHETGFIKSRLLKPFIRRNIKGASALLSIGQRNKQYYMFFGAREEQLVDAPWEIDYDDLEQFYQDAVHNREIIRNRFGLMPDEYGIVTVGRLIKRKGFDVVVDAVAKLNSDGLKVKLIVVGEGPYRPDIEKRAKEVNCPLVLVGNLDRKGVMECLTASDIFVLASSYEPWGLVVNEAAMCGLPLVLSSVVGAAVDLVQEGVNGFLFSSDSADELYNVLKEMVDNNSFKVMGVVSRSMIQRWRDENPAIAGYQLALNRIFKNKS